MKGGTSRERTRFPAIRPASLSSGTPFGQLMELLTRRHFPARAALGGDPVGFWHGFPVEEAVAHGLLLVILDLARKEGKPVETSDDVARIARRVDTLVEVGLSAGFPSAEAAAAAFVRKVADPVHRAALAGFRPEDSPPMATWKEIAAGRPVEPPAPGRPARPSAPSEIGPFLGRPAALFFVRLLNGAARYRSRLESRLADLVRCNRAHGSVTWIPDSDFDSARRSIRRIAGKGDSARGHAGDGARPHPAARAWGRWLEPNIDLEACRKRIAETRGYPVRLDALPPGIPPVSVREGWIPTLALIAVGRFRKESDFLTQAEFWKAVSRFGDECRGEKGRKPVVDRVLRSLKSRNPGVGTGTLAGLGKEVEASLGRIEKAYDDWLELLPALESIERRSAEAAAALRKAEEKLRKGGKAKAELLDGKDEAEERLSRLREEHDRLKTEFQAIHFPALFIPGSDPDGPLAGYAGR